MNKLLKKTIALLSCTILIGETMLSNAVVAIEESIKDSDLNAPNGAFSSNNFNDELTEKSISNPIINSEVGDTTSDNNNTNGNSNETNAETVKQCDSETKSSFMESLSSIINEMLENDGASNIKHTEVSDNGNTLILYTDDENAELPDLTDYINALRDYILEGKDGNNSKEYEFWSNLASKNKGLDLNITFVTNLVDFNLGESESITVNFKDCIFSFRIELKVDESEGGNNNNNDNNGYNQCSSDIKSTFMNSLSDIINETIKNSDNTGFVRAEASIDSDTIILYVEDENVKLPELNGYITGLVDHILGKESGDKPENKFWDDLASKNKGLELSITTVTNLVDIHLGTTNKLYIYFNDCSFTLNLELKVDEPSSGGSNNDSYQCSSEVKSTLINSLAEIVNDVIKNSNSTGFKRAEASIDNDTLILYVDNENVKLPNLNSYITGLVDYILGKNLDKDEVKFWADLASKNKGILMNVTAVTNLINLNLNNRNYVVVNYRDCNFPLKIELKVDNSSNGNGGNGYSGGGSSGGGSSNGGSSSSSSGKGKGSNNEEITLSGEVADDTDDKMEVKKAETCSIEGSTFSEEENQAYLWACEKGITIADNIMKANMNRNLTRAELAKMMSVYSEELLGKTRVKNESVTYPDVSDKLGDLAYYIQEGYKLQIMGIHADGSALSKFLPNSNVTRGEFGTVFSRVLYGDKYNINGANYYEKHLEVLKDAGILTKTNPKLIEKRGWILLMLYRSQKIEASNGNISNEEIVNITADEEKSGN